MTFGEPVDSKAEALCFAYSTSMILNSTEVITLDQ